MLEKITFQQGKTKFRYSDFSQNELLAWGEALRFVIKGVGLKQFTLPDLKFNLVCSSIILGKLEKSFFTKVITKEPINREGSHFWDTSKVPDFSCDIAGHQFIELTIDDMPSNLDEVTVFYVLHHGQRIVIR